MKYFDWDQYKNERLQQERDVSFEDVLIAIDSGGLLDIVEHPKKERYAHQRMLIVAINGYVYVVPFVEDEEKVFLKTIIPSRDATKKYMIDSQL